MGFDAKNTWIITVKKEVSDAGPYRAFAYLFLQPSSATTFSFTFKAVNHNKVYSKLFFWGDGNNILGLKPPSSSGGSSTFCLMPSTDSPLSQLSCPGGEYEVKADTWYRVDMALSPPGGVALSVNGKSVGSGNIQGSMSSNGVNAMLGVYHWTDNKGPCETYELHYRDMCLGTSSLTNR